MFEKGIVKEAINGNALVEVKRSAACNLCIACSLTKTGNLELKAANNIGAVRGDIVRLEIEAKGFVVGIVLLYLLPALGLIIGIISGIYLSRILSFRISQEFVAIFLGGILMFLLFFFARFYGRKAVSYNAKIVEVLKEDRK